LGVGDAGGRAQEGRWEKVRGGGARGEPEGHDTAGGGPGARQSAQAQSATAARSAQDWGKKKARAREAPDCPGLPTSDQKRALRRSRNIKSSPTVRMDDFQLLQNFCTSLLRPSWQASADLHVSWNTATTGQYDSTGYEDIGWRPNSWLVSFLVG